MAFFQSSAAAKPHAHLAGDRCPTCDQEIPNDRVAEVNSRIAARERQLQAESEARVKTEVQSVRAEGATALEQAKAQFAAREDILRAEGEKRATEALEAKLKEAAEARVAAEMRIERLQASHEAAVAARVTEVREALEKSKADAVNVEQAKYAAERIKMQGELADLQRKLQNKTASELGEGAEIDLFEALKGEFPDDIITRVKKGEAGADIIHDIRQKGVTCGRIVYDSKNHGAWRSTHASKLREDQLAAKAEHAILATNKFPAGTQQLHIESGVILANPARVVVVARILRRQVLQSHTLKSSNHEKSRKSAELYAFMTSDRFEQFVATLMGAAKDLDDLQIEERKAHDKTWRRQGEMIAKLKKATNVFDEAVERIIAASNVTQDDDVKDLEPS